MIITANDHTQLIATARHYVRRPDLTEIPSWADLPKPLADAVKARAKTLSAWEPLRTALGDSIRALDTADQTDAVALKAAAQAGRAMPKAINRDDLARAVQFNLERVTGAATALDAAESDVKAAMAVHGRELVPQALEVARTALTDHRDRMSDVQAKLDAANEVYRAAAQALADVRDIVAGSGDMQYVPPGGTPDNRLLTDSTSAAHLHDLIRILEDRGWGEGGTRTKAGAEATR